MIGILCGGINACQFGYSGVAMHGDIIRLPVLIRKKAGDANDQDDNQEEWVLRETARSRYQGTGIPPRLASGTR